MDMLKFLENMNANGASSGSTTLNEAALSQPAFEFLPMADQRFRWGYVPEKEYNGQRCVVLELDDKVWMVAMFVEGNAAVAGAKAKKTAAAKPVAPVPEEGKEEGDEDTNESMNPTKEMMKYQALAESMFRGDNVVYHGDYRLSLTEAADGSSVPTLSKIEDGGGVNKMKNWFFVPGSGVKYDFENCLKRCVEIVTGKPVEGGIQTLGMINI